MLVTVLLFTFLLVAPCVAHGCDKLNVPQMLCHSFSDPPDIAVCLGGGVRLFTRPLLHKSLVENVLNSFGAPSHLFAYLKLHDSTLKQSDDDLIAETTRDKLATLLDSYGATYEIVEAAPPGLVNCANYPELFPLSGGMVKSLVAQLESRSRCYDLIERHEKKTGRNFSWVLFARPDLVWYRPVPPWCTIVNEVRKGHRQWDHSFIFERDKARDVLRGSMQKYQNCSAPFLEGDIAEGWEGRNTWRSGTVHVRSGTVLPSFLTRNMSWFSLPSAAHDAVVLCNLMNIPGADTSQCRKMLDLNTCGGGSPP